jgi:GNAT superfamily N-acetyltransferase
VSPCPFDIQRLKADEGERLRAIRLRALRDAPDAFGSTFEESAARPLSSWRRQLTEMVTLVAVIDGADAGLARGARHPGKPGVAMLLSMWVAPDARRKGIGAALIDAVAEWARAENLTHLLLEVADQNAPAAALYSSKGFKPTGMTSTLPPPREHIREHERMLEL